MGTGCHVLFHQFHFESLSFGQASGIACFFLAYLLVFIRHIVHLLGFGPGLWSFWGLLLGEGLIWG